MPEEINQPIPNIPVQTTVVSRTAESLPPKRKFPLIWLFPLVAILVVVGGGYYYFNLRQTKEKEITAAIVTPSLAPAPTENPELIPTSTVVSSSTDTNTLEKELDNTDFGMFETDLNQLDADAGQL